MITDRTLAQLRCAAALAAVVPNVSVRIRDDRGTALEVMRPPLIDRAHRVVPTCAFHRSVARAHRLRLDGQAVDMAGLGPHEPRVELGTCQHSRVLLGGVIRMTCTDTWAHVVGIAVGPEALAQLEADCLGTTRFVRVDEVLDVALVVDGCPAGDEEASALIVSELVDLTARCGLLDIEAFLASAHH